MTIPNTRIKFTQHCPSSTTFKCTQLCTFPTAAKPGSCNSDEMGPINKTYTSWVGLFDLYWGNFLSKLIDEINSIFVRTERKRIIDVPLFHTWLGAWIHQNNTHKRKISMYWNKITGDEFMQSAITRTVFFEIYRALYHISRDMLDQREGI